jgi:serine/threonine-protein kinase RsbW
MNNYTANTTADYLILKSKLSEISRVPPWIEKVASQHALPDRTRYAMDLCLEEVLSNIIRHGYDSDADGSIMIRCLTERAGYVSVVVDDEAPPFNPLVFQDPRLARSAVDIPPGGQGIRLLKQFADALEYESKPTGNRLVIGFRSAEPSHTAI